nr:hypothetical protein [Tanacetum cinerariifolium]
MWIQQPINYNKHALWGVSHWGRKRKQFYGYAVNRESARDVYSKRRIITVTALQIMEWHDYKHLDWISRRIIAITELKIVEWHNYKHLDWISVRRDDDQIYKFKEGDFKRLLLQDIEDMLLLLVQGKLSNLTVEERFSFNVSLRMFTRSIVIQRRVEDIQLFLVNPSADCALFSSPIRIELPFLEDQFQEETPPESPMADSRTMAELLQAPTEG